MVIIIQVLKVPWSHIQQFYNVRVSLDKKCRKKYSSSSFFNERFIHFNSTNWKLYQIYSINSEVQFSDIEQSNTVACA